MWYIIILLIGLIYLYLNILMPSAGIFETYVIRPLIWISLAIITILVAYKDGLNILKFKKIRRWDIGRSPFEAALLIAGFQISMLIIFGLFLGFGKSPYSFTPFSILVNIFFVVSVLLGVEISRAYLVKKGTGSRRNITLTLAFVTIFFMLIKLSPNELLALDINDPVVLTKFIGGTIIPLLAMSLFASYLAYLGGALPAIGYMGLLQAFEWFSPVLPDLDWALTALIATIAPAIGFIIIQNSIQISQKPTNKRTRMKKTDPALSWTAVAVVCVFIVFFSTGFFGVQPTVIYSGSMRPGIDVGDIVIISEVPLEEIQVGDIIQYKIANSTTPIIHRVYNITYDGDVKLYITKGDANDEADSNPVLSEQIMGKAVFNIPKLGWVPITLKTIFGEITSSI